jgi:hypothetical protein
MIRAIISFLASALAAVQLFLLNSGREGLCFNDGCAIVDSMTSVSPLVFNLAGFCYFQTLCWLFYRGRKGSEYWHKLARLLLLAGLAAEAVLVFFQYSIATVFCSYCLIIFALIVLLNLCCGLRQLLRGIVIFVAVLVACFSLQFGAGSSGKEKRLDAGSIATLTGKEGGKQLYLFFSASCSHCEKVIESLAADMTCTVRFNPIENIENFSVPQAILMPRYDAQINRNLLQSLSLREVPILLVQGEDEQLLLKGESRIREYLETSCKENQIIDYSGTSKSSFSPTAFLPGMQSSADNSCKVDTDCEPQEPPPITNQ